MPTAYPTDLVSWWCPSLDDSANDIVGSNNGTYQGGMGTTADTGAGGVRAYDFDGTNDWIQTAGLLTRAQMQVAGAVSLWVKFDSLTGLTFSSFGLVGASTSRWYLGQNSGNAYMRIGNQADFATFALSTATWYHFVLQWTGSSGEAFVNGSSVGTKTGIGWATTGTSDGNIGSYLDGTSSFHNGMKDDIRVLDRELTADEITTLYDSGNGRGYEPAAAAAASIRPQIVSFGVNAY